MSGSSAGSAGRAERREPRVLQIELGGSAPEELGVLGVGPRPAALDVAHTQAVELPGNGELVRDREVQALLLRAVAQRGVVDVERALQVHLSSLHDWFEKEKNLSGTRGWRDGGAGALANDDQADHRGALHGKMVATVTTAT
jgi:hypothetical protein